MNPQISDEALISAFFQGPCTPVTMALPEEGWVINAATMSFPIKINGYTKPGLTEVQIEYKEKNTNDWINVKVIPAAQLLANQPGGPNLGTTISLNASDINSLPEGEGYFRLKAVCANGINNYSIRALGTKDTEAPGLVGLAEPIDDIYEVGDKISASFDEEVKLNATVELIRLDDADNNMGPLPLASGSGVFKEYVTVTPAGFITEPHKSPGAYRVVVTGLEDEYGNVAEPISWVFITEGYEVDGACSVLDIANNNNDQDAISVSNYRGTSISSDGTVPGFGETSYLATESISLESNFEVMPGGEFLADIYPCEDDLCENVTSASSKANVAGDIVWWRIEEEGDCVSGIYQTNGNAGDILVQAQNFADANEETVNVYLAYNSISKPIVLTSAGATVSFGKYLSAGGTLYTLEVILSLEEGRNDSTIVVATVKMTVLPPDTTPPVISIDPIAGDDVLDAIEVFSPLAITGTTDAEDLQEVTVSIGANTYMTAVDQGAWSVSVPAIVIQSLPQGVSHSVTADVSDFVGNAAAQVSRTFTKDDSTPAQIPISGIDYYDELMDGSYPGPSSPQGEGMDKLIDGDILTKFLSFDQTYEDPFTGEDVYVEGTVEVVLDLTTQETPSRLSVTTANDEPDRDPQVLYILGSNDGISFDNLGAAIPIACGTDRFTTRVYDIDNTTPYQYYLVRFLNQCNASANSMQLAEVAFWGN